MNKLDKEFERIRSNSKIYLRLFVNSLYSALHSLNEDRIDQALKYTWEAVTYFIQYLSSLHVRELYPKVYPRITRWLSRNRLDLSIEDVLDTIIVPRTHRHLRPRARDLEEIVDKIKGLYELVLKVEPLYMALSEGYEDEEEIKNLIREVIYRLMNYAGSLGLFR